MDGPDDEQVHYRRQEDGQEGAPRDGGGGVLSGRRVSYTQDTRYKVQMMTRKVPLGMEVEGFCQGGGCHIHKMQDATSR